MNSEEVKQGLLELLNEDTEKGRSWFFPSNVSDQYTVILGLDLKQSIKAIGTSMASLGIVILIFRSTAVFPLIIYALTGLISFGVVWAYYTLKPITDRTNISISEFLKQRKDFKKRQKVFYKRPKERI